MSLTSVFGMGTGGPSSQSLPTRLDGFEAIVYVKSFSALNSFILPLLFVAVNSSFSKSNTLVLECVRNGDPYRIRTDVKGVRGLCLNHLTNGPHFSSISSAEAVETMVHLQGLEPWTP